MTGNQEERIRLVSWNVQTFFDAKRDGCEYDDFIKSKVWGEAAYSERLRRLCDCLSKLDADVVALVELENEAVLQDISNYLFSSMPFRSRYRWAAFSKETGSSLGCAVLSRYPLEELSCHGLDVRSSAVMSRPSLRPIMRVSVVKGGRSFVLLLNHWKSMSGGRDASECWRNAQEALLESCLEELGQDPALACGDFNRDILDFEIGNDGSVLLRSGENISSVGSPWFYGDGDLQGPGSYYYKDEWSRIDGFFYSGRIWLEDFCVETAGPWCQQDSMVPKKYKLWSGWGYSDHLPISCTVTF
ncbi:MAG: endonuclease/exonuclease/phosphatase family protein [Treponema sp.]|nr:endonuclease/exonuclease/phosphatase family protein [Treponema sp.]